MDLFFGGDVNKITMTFVVRKFLHEQKIYVFDDTKEVLGIPVDKYIFGIYRDQKKSHPFFWYKYLAKLIDNRYLGSSELSYVNDLEDETYEFFVSRMKRWASKNEVNIRVVK